MYHISFRARGETHKFLQSGSPYADLFQSLEDGSSLQKKDHVAITVKRGDEYKTGFVTPHRQYIYLRMGQGLAGACAAYAQFTDLVFGPLPKTEAVPAIPSMIGDHGKTAFCPFVDDHMGAATDFDSLFDFLHLRYFPRVVFGPAYLSGHKTYVFTNSLEMLGFTGSAEGLRLSVKHRQRVTDKQGRVRRDNLDYTILENVYSRSCRVCP